MERKHCKHKKIRAIQQELDYFKYKIREIPKVGPQSPAGTIGKSEFGSLTLVPDDILLVELMDGYQWTR